MRIVLFNLSLLYATVTIKEDSFNYDAVMHTLKSILEVILLVLHEGNIYLLHLIKMRSYSKYIIGHAYLFNCEYNRLKSHVLLKLF